MDEKYNVNGQGAAANGPAAPAQPPRKVRRVGTFTFGLLLVVAGIMLILRTVMPSLDLRFVVNLLPVALIALGIEVLVYAARPNVQLKYDGLSIFVCILILIGVGGSSIAVQLWNEYGISAQTAQMRLGDELEKSATETLRDVSELNSNISDLSVVLDFNHGITDIATASVQPGDRVELYVTVYAGRYDSPEAFATMARQVVDTCQAAGLPFNRYRFDTYYRDVADNMVTYSLNMDTEWQITASVDALAESVYQSYWYDGASYSSYDDMEDYRIEEILNNMSEEYAEEFGSYPTEQWIDEQRAILKGATPESGAPTVTEETA